MTYRSVERGNKVKSVFKADAVVKMLVSDEMRKPDWSMGMLIYCA